jgi:hypothetical protein
MKTTKIFSVWQKAKSEISTVCGKMLKSPTGLDFKKRKDFINKYRNTD